MNEINHEISTEEENNLIKNKCKVRSATNLRKVRSVTNQWNFLEDQILGQAWIGYK